MILCSKCKNYSPKYFKFCGHCGEILEQDRQQAFITTDTGEEVPVIEMAICEVEHLVLKTGELYRFYAMPGCEKCAKLESFYKRETK